MYIVSSDEDKPSIDNLEKKKKRKWEWRGRKSVRGPAEEPHIPTLSYFIFLHNEPQFLSDDVRQHHTTPAQSYLRVGP